MMKSQNPNPPRPKALLLDLDGTVYAGAQEVPGAAAFIRDATAAGIRCLYVTNRSNRTPDEVCAQLATYGIACTTDDIVSTAIATARYVRSGSAYVIGEAGLTRALEEQGITLTDTAPDTVIVSIDREFSYEKLKTACRLISQGATYIATNLDPRLKTATGLVPGTGSIVAAVTTASGVSPLVIGKPERHLMEMALQKCGCDKAEAWVVGDGLDTDIAAAINADLTSVLLLTGVTSREDLAASTLQPTYIAEHFAELRALMRLD